MIILKDECKKRGFKVGEFLKWVPVADNTVRDWCSNSSRIDLVFLLLDTFLSRSHDSLQITETVEKDNISQPGEMQLDFFNSLDRFNDWPELNDSDSISFYFPSLVVGAFGSKAFQSVYFGGEDLDVDNCPMDYIKLGLCHKTRQSAELHHDYIQRFLLSCPKPSAGD